MALTSAQKAAVTQFVTFTSADKKSAEKILRAHNWNVQAAVDGFFSGARGVPAADPHAPALSKLFDQYRGAPNDEPDKMQIESTMSYLTDLSVSLESITVLIFSDLVSSPTMGEVPRDGFISGWSPHGATTISAQKKILDALTLNLQRAPLAGRTASDSLFRSTYKTTFRIAVPAGARAIPLEMATEYWKLVFGPQSGLEWTTPGTPWLDWWLEFLEARWKKAVNKDLWEQTLRFSQETMRDESMDWWSEEAAWPGVIDEFVQWAKERRQADGGSMDTE